MDATDVWVIIREYILVINLPTTKKVRIACRLEKRTAFEL